MSIARSYLFSAQNIIESYEGSIPFAAWVKNYFRENKKFGSRDRKNILQLCYSYFRLGKAFSFLPIEEKLLTALFLTVNEPHVLLKELKPQWADSVQLSLPEKFLLAGMHHQEKDIFPFPSHVSKEIDLDSFRVSHLVQPLVFLRARPGKQKMLEEKFINHGLAFTKISEDAYSVPAGIKIEEIIHLNREAVVQDLNSQQTMALTGYISGDAALKVWDCCAASGGKSILLFDKFPRAELWVSDVRASIISNLKKRFLDAGIKNYHSFVADVSRPDFHIRQMFDLIICDAPCTGSGTWSRTPEQLVFFPEEKIAHYASLQLKIATQALRQLQPGGYFLYITCSVFAAENEEQVREFLKDPSLKLREQKYLKGYNKRADTLFVALLSREGNAF